MFHHALEVSATVSDVLVEDLRSGIRKVLRQTTIGSVNIPSWNKRFPKCMP